MNYKKVFFPIALVVIIAAVPVLSRAPLIAATPGVPEAGLITSQLKAEVVGSKIASANSIPTHLAIPDAKVNTNIIEVGVTPQGNLDVPNNYTEVGWYKYGTRPGEMGSAVLDGHVDNGGKIPGPFKKLRNLEVGDDIYVTMSDGSVLHYRTTVSKVYDLNKFPGEEVFHQSGNRYLKIITCHGKFVKSLGTYDQRLIVTAVLVA